MNYYVLCVDKKTNYYVYCVNKKTFDTFHIGDIFNNQEVVEGTYVDDDDAFLLITRSEKNDEKA